MLRSGLIPMNLRRAATIVVVGGALAVWLAAAATSGNREVASPLVVETPAVDARGAELAAEVARLHDRLRPDAAPKHTRNLFAFAIQKPRPAAVVAPPAPALTEAPRPPVAPPPLKLVGVAENAGPNGPERTAIISGFGQLFLVKEGENVTMRYRVAKVAADVVELADAGDGTTLRLALKP
jgi:hypothetical protein